MRLDVLTLEQCQLVREWRNQCLETLRTPYPLTKEQQEEFYKTRVCAREGPHRYWAIIGEVREPVDRTESRTVPVPNMVAVTVMPHPIGDRTVSFVGMGGLTYIQWENRIAEISLILDPAQRGKGFGEQAVDLLLEQAFDRLGLKTVVGEVYGCNTEGIRFWAKMVDKYRPKDEPKWQTIPPFVRLHNRKFWKGQFWPGEYFEFDADDWRKVHGKPA